MILRKYGATYQSVDLNFDSKALNEVGFRRNREFSMSVEDLDAGYVLAKTSELVAEAEGEVQDHTEQLLLDRLESQIDEIRRGLADGELLVVENEQGHDYPKTKSKTTNVIVEGENKLHFAYSIAPPLRIGRYQPKA
jgi:hypothetical protein